MEKSTLKMVVSSDQMNSEYSDYLDTYRDSSWWYLHGELQKESGYDKAVIVGGLRVQDLRNTIDWTEIREGKVVRVRSESLIPTLRLNGEYPVEMEGVSEPCTGYFWTTSENFVSYNDIIFTIWKQRGLVVKNSDALGREYAVDMYTKKSELL